MKRSLTAILLLSLLGAAFLLGQAAPPDRRIKLEVSDPAVAERLLQAGAARLVADYGAFRLLEADPETVANLGPVPGLQRRDAYDQIALNTGWLDTRAAKAATSAKSLTIFSGKRLHLVQYAGPIRPDWFAALQLPGLEVVTYIPFNAYLVYLDANALGRLRELAGRSGSIQYEGEYLDRYKIQPGALAADRQKSGAPGPDGYAIQLVRDPQANADTICLLDRYRQGAYFQDYEILNYRNLTVTIPESRLAELAARPDVVSIQPWLVPELHDERQDQIMANHLSGGAPTGPGYLAWLTGLGFTQEQFTASAFGVDVTDSGLDNATNLPNHFALYVNGIRPGTSRVSYNRIYGTAGSSAGKGCNGHGTVNAHIVAGYNALTGSYHEDAAGYNYGLGVCPWVKVGSSVIFDPSYTSPPSFADIQSDAYASGARISTNSWGSHAYGAYTSDCQTYDALVRDAQSGILGNQEMVILFSAGNDGDGANTIGAPGGGKNLFTVGAAENVHPFGGADGCGVGDSGADNANDIIDFSSRGPCDDGRVKPDIQAPGTHISGGTFQVAEPPAAGDADSCFTSGVCGGVGSLFWPAGQEWTTASSGTSHSTPAVAGAAALLRQWFINQSLTPPSPAMTKAYFMNSTRYMTGLSANDTLPSHNQGMGEIDLSRAFDGEGRVLRDQSGRFTASGQSRTITGNILDPGQPFRVTLAWTDAPGPTSGNAYKNNLDLAVTVGGQTYYGNVFSGQASTTGGTADLKNNVESVFLPAGLRGSYTVTVTAANINSDGVPGNDQALDQDFALVIYNADEVLLPAMEPAQAALTVEGCLPANGAPDPDETVSVSFTLNNIGTAATTNLVATLQATGGVLSPDGPHAYGAIAPAGSGSQTFSFTVDPATICGQRVTATLALADGALDLGTVAFDLDTGVDATVTFLSENFDGVTAPNLPANWQKTDTLGSSGDWFTNVGTRWPSGTAAVSAPNVVLFNSFSANTGNNTRLYCTTPIDLGDHAGETILVTFWMFHDPGYSTANDRVQVQISTDEGDNWTDVGDPVSRYRSSTGWLLHTVDLSAYAGLSDVRLAFHGISAYGNDCHLDDITVRTEELRACCESSFPKGDLNHDLAVDGADLLVLADYLAGADLPLGTTAAECDLLADSAVDAGDLTWLQNEVAGNNP